MNFLIIAGMGLITYAIRLSLILASHRFQPPEAGRRALRFVPTAVLSAIIAAEVLLPGGEVDLSLGNERLLAGLIAGLIAWRFKNVVVTILAGMVALWILQYFGI